MTCAWQFEVMIFICIDTRLICYKKDIVICQKKKQETNNSLQFCLLDECECMDRKEEKKRKKKLMSERKRERFVLNVQIYYLFINHVILIIRRSEDQLALFCFEIFTADSELK